MAASRRSRALHRPWVRAPGSGPEYRAFLERQRSKRHASHLLIESESGQLAGVVNINEIVQGSFQSGYLGYYLFAPFEGRGYMFEGLRLVLSRGFRSLGLHRVEANIQPENARSIELVRFMSVACTV